MVVREGKGWHVAQGAGRLSVKEMAEAHVEDAPIGNVGLSGASVRVCTLPPTFILSINKRVISATYNKGCFRLSIMRSQQMSCNIT
jgi:hypothetical protein